MKIETAKNDLEFALNTVRMAVGNGTDITSHYLFRVHNDKVEVLAQNLRVFAGAPLISNFTQDEHTSFTVESWRLDKWMSGVGDGVLTLEFNGGGDVHAKSGRSKVRLRSLDPSKFPYWDKLQSNAKTVGNVNPENIIKALSLTKGFVSNDDTVKPELCQVESIGGTFWATDRKAVASVKVPLKDLDLRIPAKDITPLTKFLSNETDITIQNASRDNDSGSSVIFVKESGHYLGVTRPTTQFPTLALDMEKAPECVIKVDLNELNAGVNVLQASAPKGHDSVTFSWNDKTEKVVLSMPSVAGGNDEYPLALTEFEEIGEKFDTFTIDFPYLRSISSTFSLDTLSLGVHKMGRGGYTSFKHTDSEDENSNIYYAVIVWRT